MAIVIEACTHDGAPWGRLSSLPEINERARDDAHARELAVHEISRWRSGLADAYPDMHFRLTEATR